MSEDPRFKKKSGENIRIDGLRAAAELLNALDPEHRQKLMTELYTKDPGLTRKIEDRMYTFEDLVELSEDDWRILFQAVPRGQMVLALRRGPQPILDVLGRSLTARAWETLQEEVAAQGPKRVSDIQVAQMAIAKVALKLKQEGKIAKSAPTRL